MGSWGHEYVRGLSGEIGEEYHTRTAAEEPVDDLLELVALIVPYHMSHNAGALARAAALLPASRLALSWAGDQNPFRPHSWSAQCCGAPGLSRQCRARRSLPCMRVPTK